MNTSVLEILSKNHKEWCTVVRSFGEVDNYEDIVQDMYIRVSGYEVETSKLTKPYVWMILRNMYYAQQNKKNKNIEIRLEKDQEIAQVESCNTHGLFLFLEKYQSELESWHWYSRTIYEYSITSSARKIARESGVSLRSICYEINKCKKRLKEVLSEDYEDYLNKDYELIK
jgi:DNA-directed RNA polymerase specialized sigma24 family protein